MASLPHKRPSPGADGAREHKRARTDKGKQTMIEKDARERNAQRTPSPGAGAKRAGTDLQSDGDGSPKKVVDTRAIYDANKQQIDDWYDEDYSRKQGIMPHGKLLRSNHRWYQKLAAWMEMKGMSQSTKKKRKMNYGTPVSDEAQESRPPRPHEIRYPEDLVSVPEYPLDRLQDYTPMDDGHYACSHVHLKPPKPCCVFGLTREAKRQSIKKSIYRWRGNVEKLIDKGELDKRHKTWTGWIVEELRKKHQPALWNRQQAKKQADIENKKAEERQRAERQAEMGGSSVPPMANEHATQRHPAIQRSASVTSPGRQPSTHSVSTTAGSVAAPAPAGSQLQRSVVPTRRRSDPNAIVSAQSLFFANLAHTNPRLQRSYDALYHDAQYRENLKEHPNLAHLKGWYLAFFLEQQQQPLSAEQRTLLGSGDPSYDGKKRFGGVATLKRVDKLFSEYIQAARTEKLAQQTQRQQQKSSAAVELQSAFEGSPTPSQPLTLGTVHTESPVQTDAQGYSDMSDDVVMKSTTVLESEPVSHTAFEILDYDTLDNELDRILGTGPVRMTQPAVRASEPQTQAVTALRTEASYITLLPQAFATGNQTVDDEMQRMLNYAYQTQAASSVFISEDEQLLRQTIEDCRPDWQRYCDFFGDEHSLSGSPAPTEQTVVDEFDFGEPLSEEQLAMLDFDDPIGERLFAQLDERVAAAHAANLARYR